MNSILCKLMCHNIDYSWTRSFQVTDSICVDVYKCKRCGEIIEYACMQPTKEAAQKYKDWLNDQLWQAGESSNSQVKRKTAVKQPSSKIG